MNVQITRNVILDLLPLYVADEASEDTRSLIEEYLENDPELADRARQLTMLDLDGSISVPLTKEDKMKAYLEAKRLMFWRTVILATLACFTFLTVLAMVGLVATRFFH